MANHLQLAMIPLIRMTHSQNHSASTHLSKEPASWNTARQALRAKKPQRTCNM